VVGTFTLVASVLAANAPAKGGEVFHRAYKRDDLDLIYNLLFCDNAELLRPKSGTPTGALATLLAKAPRIEDLRELAEDDTAESRLRAAAFHRLRAAKVDVPRGLLLGVIVEVPLDDGLDVLAAFADGRMRYINQSGKLAVFESTPAAMAVKQAALLDASAAAIRRIGPWPKPRLPPPRRGSVRLSFLVSDGLYFGEGPMTTLSNDELGGPVLSAATALLQAIVGESSKPR